MKDILEKYSLAQLKKIVRRSNIVGYTKFDKDELIKKMMESQHKSNFKYLKKLKHDSADDRKNNMKLVDGDLKVRREANKVKREANKKKKADDLKSNVPALTERKTAKKAVKTRVIDGTPVKPPRGVLTKKAIENFGKLKDISDRVKKTKDVKPKKKVEIKKKEEPKKRVNSSMANFKKSQEGKADINTLNEFYKNIRMGKSSMYNKVSDIKSIIKILKSNNQKVNDNFSITRKEILLESAEEILEGLSSSKDKPKKEEKKVEPKIEPKIEGKKKVFKKLDFEEKKKQPVKKKVEKPKSKPIVYKTPMMKKEEKKQAKLKQDKSIKATQKAIDAFDKPKKKKEKSSDSTNNKKELHAKYLKKFKSLQDKNIKVSMSQFEPKKEIDRDEIEEKIEKITRVIISLEEDIKKTDSTRLKELLPYFINMKKTYNLDLKNE